MDLAVFVFQVTFTMTLLRQTGNITRTLYIPFMTLTTGGLIFQAAVSRGESSVAIYLASSTVADSRVSEAEITTVEIPFITV